MADDERGSKAKKTAKKFFNSSKSGRKYSLILLIVPNIISFICKTEQYGLFRRGYKLFSLQTGANPEFWRFQRFADRNKSQAPSPSPHSCLSTRAYPMHSLRTLIFTYLPLRDNWRMNHRVQHNCDVIYMVSCTQCASLAKDEQIEHSGTKYSVFCACICKHVPMQYCRPVSVYEYRRQQTRKIERKRNEKPSHFLLCVNRSEDFV